MRKTAGMGLDFTPGELVKTKTQKHTTKWLKANKRALVAKLKSF